MSRRTPPCLGLLLLLLPVALVAAVPLDVRGTVRGPDGRPLAGAQVDLLPLRSNLETSRGLLAGAGGPEPVASVRSDSLGRFAAPAPGTGVWKVTVKAEGFVPMQYSPLPVANAVELPPLTLTRDVGATVEVRDAKGKPARGIRVYATGNKASVWRLDPNGWRPASRTGSTGADGTLRLPRARGEWLDVSVFPPGSAIPQVARKSESARVSLDPAASRPGPVIEVRDAKGKPVAGVLVGVGDLVWPAGTTGPDGRLRLTGRPVETEDVFLMTEDGRRRRGKIEPGQEKASLVFPAAVRLAGQVVDGTGRKPVAGALVWSGLDPGAFTLSDEKGGYEVPAAEEKDAWVQGEAAGLLPRLAPFEAEETKGGRAPLLVLPLPATFAGVVVDRRGAPVPGVTLDAVAGASSLPRAPSFRLDKTAGRAISDAQGRFRFERLALATPYELSAEKKGFVPATVKVEPPGPAGTREDVRIVLAQTATPFGRVVDREDKPLADVEVTLRPEGKKSVVRPTSLRDEDEEAPFTARTDSSGRFELAEAPAPSVDIAAHKPGFAALTVRGVPIPKGEGPVDLGTLVLEPGAGIAGVV
ncbi:MAG TPA: carboxypeptidase regulatory-like domain-containing protein, partial [Thermoanaerobaculia bacterium]|nr:carboxypeptidase regulatory-like domain-containing protein [Thermoanaerobaculia bacterium]